MTKRKGPMADTNPVYRNGRIHVQKRLCSTCSRLLHAWGS